MKERSASFNQKLLDKVLMLNLSFQAVPLLVTSPGALYSRYNGPQAVRKAPLPIPASVLAVSATRNSLNTAL